MALIKSLADLEDWPEYRKFIIAAFKSTKEGSEFFVSKNDFDFEIKGKPWPGRVALFGDKGNAAMAALKREGMQFKPGTCRLVDGDIAVTGLSEGLLKGVNKTFKKLPVSGKAVADKGVADDGKDQDAKAKDASAVDNKEVEATKKLKGAVYDQLKAVVASKPANQKQLVAEFDKAQKLEKKGDHAGAQKALAELQKQLKAADADASDAAKLKGKVKAKKSAVRSSLTDVLAAKPANQGAIAKLVKKSGEQEKAGQWQEALDSLTELEAEIANAENAANDTDDDADADADADASALKDTAEKQKAELVKRAKKVLAEDPSQREPIARILKEADALEKKQQYDDQLDKYEELEDLLDSVSPASAEDEDIELNSIEDWQQYRKWVRARFKKLPKEAKKAEPIYVSRKKQAFDLGGRKWRGHAVIAGKKSRSLAKELKRSGLLLLQGACYKEGKVLFVSGMASAALKVAGKTLKLLKLGYTLEPMPAASVAAAEASVAAEEGTTTAADNRSDEYGKRRAALEPKLQEALANGHGDTSRMRASASYAQEAADGGDWDKAINTLTRLEQLVAEAESAPADTDVIATGLVKYRSSLVKFDQAKKAAQGQLDALNKGIGGVPEQEDLVDAVSKELNTLFDDISNVVDAAINASKDDAAPVTAAVRSEVDRAFNEIGGSALLTHIESSPWGVSVKKPLLAALTGIRDSMPA